MYASVMSFMLRMMPKRLYTAALGKFAKSRWSAKFVPWYARHYAIDTSELAKPILSYETLGQFFTRQLQATARPIGSDLVSPVDGTVSTLGDIDGVQLLQVKGHPYTLDELLGDGQAAQAFVGGKYFTVYLSPSDYHRIHAPLACRALRCCHIPGTLYPVNAHGVQHIPRLFVRNERVITYFHSEAGPFALVKVGAAGVGSVITPYVPARTWRDRHRGQVLDVACEQSFQRGEEIGFFALGSTVVVLFPSSVDVKFTVSTGARVQMGQTIGQMREDTEL